MQLLRDINDMYKVQGVEHIGVEPMTFPIAIGTL